MPRPPSDTQLLFSGNDSGGQPCPACGELCDVTRAAPLEEVRCDACGKWFTAKNIVDNYRLITMLGEGASGRVYLAEDSNLHRKVAVKILRKAFESSPQMWGRLEKEARAAASANHGNVVGVYRLARLQGRRPYMVMEYLENGTLERMFGEPPPDENTLRSIALDVLEGLKAAVEKGLIHGDVKPANLLRDAKNRTKVGDFGLARLMSEEDENVFLGTPFYMAPEIIGQTGHSFHSDMYSLGATLYHLATGHPPFPGKRSEEVMQKAMDDPTPKLETERPDLSKKFCGCVHRMMQKDPKARYTDYDEAIHVLSDGKRGHKPPRAGFLDWVKWLFLD